MGIDIGKLQLVPISYCQEKNEEMKAKEKRCDLASPPLFVPN